MTMQRVENHSTPVKATHVPGLTYRTTIPVCNRCESPTVDPGQEHPGICVCGGFITDMPFEPKAGAYDVRMDGLQRGYFPCICPCGCGNFMNLPIRVHGVPHREGGAEWEWNGDTEAPTLAPSIRDMNCCRFHGHLQNGLWTFCGDSGVK